MLSNGFCKIADLLVFTHSNQESEAIVRECRDLGVRVVTENINKFSDEVKRFHPDIILSCYYRFIINEAILSEAKRGSFNVHPSLLPHYKGTFSCPWVIINGERFAGVSIHKMVKEVDEGNIILQRAIEITEFDTAYSLYHRLASLAISMLPEALTLIADGFDGVPQSAITDESKAYYPRRLPYDGIIKSTEHTLDEAKRFIRAMWFPPHKGGSITFNNGNCCEFTHPESLDAYADQFLTSGQQ